jgi:hypothetical protein
MLAFMLTTSRAIVLAAALVVAGLLAHAAIPRYELHTFEQSGVVTRTDRWTGRVELTSVQHPASWVTTSQSNSDQFAAALAAVRAANAETPMDRALRFSRTVGVLLGYGTVAVGLAYGVQRARRQLQPKR